jgi:hypothetical protein
MIIPLFLMNIFQNMEGLEGLEPYACIFSHACARAHACAHARMYRNIAAKLPKLPKPQKSATRAFHSSFRLPSTWKERI